MTISKEQVEGANRKAVERMMDSEPVWVDIAPASKKMGLRGKVLLHAGPPMKWKDASGPMKGAIIGAALYEGWAESEKQASRLAEEGEIEVDCDHTTTRPVPWPACFRRACLSTSLRIGGSATEPTPT